jgi:predicted Zn-dependent peptidase
LYKKNEENDLFDLYYKYDLGSNNNKKLSIAMSYWTYLGTEKYSSEQIQQEFYKLACSYDASVGEDEVTVHLSGLSENFDKAIALLEEYLADAQPDKAVLENLINDILKSRVNAKQDKNTILQVAMKNFGIYGEVSPFTNVLSEEELRMLQPEELTSIIHDLNNYSHHVLYYGPLEGDSIKKDLAHSHKVPAQFKTAELAAQFIQLPTKETKVYVVEYPMQQAEILMISKGELYNRSVEPYMAVFNSYFGTGMSSLVFQEIRESKALAYQASTSYSSPRKADDAHYITVYVGTQADKLPEAMAGMTSLINNMPEVSNNFEATKSSMVQKMRTDRTVRANVLLDYDRAKKLGLDYDRRKDNFEKVKNITFADINSFYQQHIKDKPYTILVMGDKSKLDIKTLEKYGKVEFVTLDQIFGYKDTNPSITMQDKKD